MSATLTSTPAADGYRMPGEFEPHSGCWIVWPERPDNWRLGAKPAQQAYAAAAEAINVSEPVTMAVSDAQFEHCRSVLAGLNRSSQHRDRGGAVRAPRRGEDDLARARRLQRRDERARYNLACFARPGVVLLTSTEDEADPQHAISRDAQRRLEAATDASGRAIEVVLLPSPGPVTISEEEAAGVDAVAGSLPRRAGDRLAASYVNFYLATKRIVFPLLDERYDEQASEILSDCFPEREVVGVPAREVLLGGGNIHCITQQVPVVALGTQADAAVAVGGRCETEGRRHGAVTVRSIAVMERVPVRSASTGGVA